MDGWEACMCACVCVCAHIGVCAGGLMSARMPVFGLIWQVCVSACA